MCICLEYFRPKGRCPFVSGLRQFVADFDQPKWPYTRFPGFSLTFRWDDWFFESTTCRRRAAIRRYLLRSLWTHRNWSDYEPDLWLASRSDNVLRLGPRDFLAFASFPMRFLVYPCWFQGWRHQYRHRSVPVR